MIKLFAFLFMVTDHIGFYLEELNFPNEWLIIVLRLIGRLSMPLFVFSLYQGVIYTSNIKKYFMRIFSLAIVSQFFYHFFVNQYSNSFLPLNILFMFSLILLIEILSNKISEHYSDYKLDINLICLFSFLLIIFFFNFFIGYSIFNIKLFNFKPIVEYDIEVISIYIFFKFFFNKNFQFPMLYYNKQIINNINNLNINKKIYNSYNNTNNFIYLIKYNYKRLIVFLEQYKSKEFNNYITINYIITIIFIFITNLNFYIFFTIGILFIITILTDKNKKVKKKSKKFKKFFYWMYPLQFPLSLYLAYLINLIFS